MYRYDISGGSWDSIGLVPDTNVSKLAINGNNLFAGTRDKGVFRSIDGGITWSSANGLADTNIAAIAASGSNVSVGTQDSGVYVSIDNGLNWTKKPGANLELDSAFINAVVMNSSYLFTCGGTFNGVYYSTTLGQRWTHSGPANIFVSLLVSNNNLYAGSNGYGSFISSDNGLTWLPLSSPTRVFAFATSGNYLFYGSKGGISYSANNGKSYSSAGYGITIVGVNNLNKLAIIGNNVFAVGPPNGIFQTTLPTSLP